MTKWLGCDHIEFIWHGEWADPELKFKDSVIDQWSIEEFCCEAMKEEGLDYKDNGVYSKWVREHQSLIEATIVEFAEAKNN